MDRICLFLLQVTLTCRSVAKVNDKVISFTKCSANRWTNWGRDNAEGVGILFGDSGILTKRAGQPPCWFPRKTTALGLKVVRD